MGCQGWQCQSLSRRENSFRLGERSSKLVACCGVMKPPRLAALELWVRQSSREGARMLLVGPGTCLTSRFTGGGGKNRLKVHGIMYFRDRKSGHYERGLFVGGPSRISKNL